MRSRCVREPRKRVESNYLGFPPSDYYVESVYTITTKRGYIILWFKAAISAYRGSVEAV